jgi:hypothetical protein
MGLVVFLGALAFKSRAFKDGAPETGSRTAGTSLKPSDLQRAKRLNPSKTS